MRTSSEPWLEVVRAIGERVLRRPLAVARYGQAQPDGPESVAPDAPIGMGLTRWDVQLLAAEYTVEMVYDDVLRELYPDWPTLPDFWRDCVREHETGRARPARCDAGVAAA